MNVGNFDLLHMLVKKHGADVNAIDKEGQTPLHLAASLGSPQMVYQIITELNASLLVLDIADYNASDIAFMNGNPDTQEVILELAQLGPKGAETSFEEVMKRIQARRQENKIHEHQTDRGKEHQSPPPKTRTESTGKKGSEVEACLVVERERLSGSQQQQSSSSSGTRFPKIYGRSKDAVLDQDWSSC